MSATNITHLPYPRGEEKHQHHDKMPQVTSLNAANNKLRCRK